MPKIAALLAAARLPDPEPVPTVTYRSQGRLLIIGAARRGRGVAALVGDTLAGDVCSRTGRAGGAQERRWPVIAGATVWSSTAGSAPSRCAGRATTPIDLDLCTRCNACVAACPEQAIGLDYQIDHARLHVATAIA